MRYACALGFLALPLLAAPAFGQPAYNQPAYDEVAAIFAARCYGCHAAKVKMGSLNLETYEGVRQGGNHGQIVVAGNSGASRLYLMIAGKAAPAMPMDGTKLTAAQIGAVRNWIDQGAPPPEAEAAPAAAPRIQPAVPVQPRIFDLAYSPAGDLIALGGFREVRLIDASTRRQVATLAGAADAVRAVAFSSDGKLLAAAGGLPARAGEILIFDVASRRLLHALRGHADCIYAVAFSPDGKSVAASSYDKLIKLWDIARETEIRTYKDHIDAVYALAFTPDGRLLVSGAADRTVKVWNVETGQRLYTLSDSQDGVNAIAIHPAGKLIAAGGLDKTIRVWLIGEKGGTLVNSVIAHEDAILRLNWSPDGAELVSSSADRTVKVFEAAGLAELKSFAEPDWVYGLRFAPGGKTLAIGAFDGALTLVPADFSNPQAPGASR